MSIRERDAAADEGWVDLAPLTLCADRRALLVALDALVEAAEALMFDIRGVAPDEPHERMIPTQHRVLEIRQLRAALAKAKEATDG